MRRPWIVLAVVTLGCAPEAPKVAAKTIVGTWDVSGEFAPIVQTFDAQGRFVSKSDVEIALGKDQRLKATISFTGTYHVAGDRLATTIKALDVANVPEKDRENIIRNGQENLNKSFQGKMEWKSPERLYVHQSGGQTLLYKRIH